MWDVLVDEKVEDDADGVGDGFGRVASFQSAFSNFLLILRAPWLDDKCWDRPVSCKGELDSNREHVDLLLIPVFQGATEEDLGPCCFDWEGF